METEIKSIIEEFLSKTGLDFNGVSTDIQEHSSTRWFSVDSSDSHLLIGKDGETLQTINYLVKRIIEKRYKDNTPRVSIDVNGYQKEKIEKIKTIAHMMSERARFFKSKIELPPMNPFERLIVHEYVSAHDDLSSESAGTGRDRHVVISYVKD